MNKSLVTFAALSAALPALALAQISIVDGTAGAGQVSVFGSYSENFDTLSSNGSYTNSSSVGNEWVNNFTIPGWYSTARSNGTYSAAYYATAGGSTSSQLYSAGTGSTDTDRSLSGLASGSYTPTFALVLSNQTGATITGFDLSYDLELWRDGSDPSAVTFGYQIVDAGTGSISGLLTNVGSLTFTPPAGNTGAVNPGTTSSFNFTLDGLTLDDNQEIWLTWTLNRGSGNANLIGLDNVSITNFVAPGLVAVPEPSTYAMIAGGLALIVALSRRRRQSQ